MVLNAQFWFEYAKNNIIEEIEEKIIRDDILLDFIKPTRTVIVSYSNHSCSETKKFIYETIQIIKDKLVDLKIQNIAQINWQVRETDKPGDLQEKLQELQFKKLLTVIMMGIDLQQETNEEVEENPEFEVKGVPFDELYDPRILEIVKNNFSEDFETIAEVKNYLNMRREAQNKLGDKPIQYVAYTVNTNLPVAYGSMTIKKKIPSVAYLNGAATDKKFRNKGLYTNILTKRIKEGKKMGLKYLTIDADEKTSAPILQKHGFKQFDKFEVYRLAIEEK